MPHRNVLTSRGSPLIKFQSADRIESLRSGKLYAKNLGYYRNLEKHLEMQILVTKMRECCQL